jgi:hypothetical protein
MNPKIHMIRTLMSKCAYLRKDDAKFISRLFKESLVHGPVYLKAKDKLDQCRDAICTSRQMGKMRQPNGKFANIMLLS